MLNKKRSFFSANDPSISAVHPFAPLDPMMAQVVIVGVEWKRTKANPRGPMHTGSYLQIDCTITSDEGKGRKLTERYNLFNKSEAAVQVARHEFKGLCDAVDVSEIEHPNDVTCLMGKKANVMVGVEIGNDGRKRNRIEQWFVFGNLHDGGHTADNPDAPVSNKFEDDIPF